MISSCSMLVEQTTGSLSCNLPQNSRVLDTRAPITFVVTLTDESGLYVYEQVAADKVVFTDLIPTNYTLNIQGEDSNYLYSYSEKVEILPGENEPIKAVLNKTPR